MSLPLNRYRKVAVDFCSDQGAMKEQSLSSVTEEQRGYGQKDQDLVFNEFSGNDTSSITKEITMIPAAPRRYVQGFRPALRFASAGLSPRFTRRYPSHRYRKIIRSDSLF